MAYQNSFGSHLFDDTITTEKRWFGEVRNIKGKKGIIAPFSS